MIPGDFDLGETPEGFHQFTPSLLNKRQHPVRIAYVSRSCDCADVRVSSDPIAPGESVDLNCTWDLRGYQGPTETNLTIWVDENVTDLSTTPSTSVPFSLRATVLPQWSLVPNAITFSAGEASRQRVAVVPMDGEQVDVATVSSDHPALQCVLHADQGEFEVQFDPTLWRLPGTAVITVRTTSTLSPVRRLSVRVAAR